MLLETHGLTRRFGGLLAVDDVNLAVQTGEVRAIIGPNGAGKTTLVGMICGRVAPSAGRIVFDGEDITHLPPWQRVARGIVYTFQVTSVFGTLSVFDNVALAAQRRLLRGPGQLLHVDPAALQQRTHAALAAVGLLEHLERRAEELPYGHQRLLEIAMGLALEPRLLVLDEPTQGLAEDDIDSFCTRVRDIASSATVLLIEHNVPVVLALASRITVLHHGQIIAEGDAAAIEADAGVQQAYLGRR